MRLCFRERPTEGREETGMSQQLRHRVGERVRWKEQSSERPRVWGGLGTAVYELVGTTGKWIEESGEVGRSQSMWDCGQ